MVISWTKDCEDVLEVFEKHRAIQIEIARNADRLAMCESRETITYSENVIRAAEQIPALQRMIERAEAIAEDIVAECHIAAPLLDQCVDYLQLLADKRHREIIRVFYIFAMPMEVAAAKVCYSRRWCEELRDEAISIIAEKTAHQFA